MEQTHSVVGLLLNDVCGDRLLLHIALGEVLDLGLMPPLFFDRP